MEVELVSYPSAADYRWCKQCAIGTVGLHMKTDPDNAWLHKLADAEHSPIRELWFRFYLRDIPYWVSNELCRHHEGIEKYVRSQRNDRQKNYDRNEARQDAPVDIRVSVNAQALINIAHKRLCGCATAEMQYLVGQMCREAVAVAPWLQGLLVPMCLYRGGCHEMKGCGFFGRWHADGGD